MKNKFRKLVRTSLVYLPFLQEMKPVVQRFLDNIFKVPFEREFEALSLFPDIEDALYLDVGGNRGLAIDAIRMFKPLCKIMSFEPNQPLSEKTASYFRRDKNTNVCSYGLGEKELEIPLYVPAYRGIPVYGLASFYRSNAASSLNEEGYFFFKNENIEIRECLCKIKRLDSLGIDPFFIKLDVQGYELAVLRGGAETIRRSLPILLIESVDEDQMDFLKQFGYRVYAYDGRSKTFIKDTKGSINSFVMTDDKFMMLKKR